MTYERANIARLHGYTPGEQPRGKAIKLNTNENPYPPVPAVLEAIRNVSAEALRRYPPPLAPALRATAAKVHGLKPEQVLATNGGDELLRMAITAFCQPRADRPSPCPLPGGEGAEGRRRAGGSGEPSPCPLPGGEGAEGALPGGEGEEGRRAGGTEEPSPCPLPGGEGETGGLGIAEPSYSLYPILADIHDTPVTRVWMAEDFALPADLGEKWNAAGCRLGLIVNPHAPSGRLEPLDKLEHIARSFHGVLMIDEAYVDFAQRDALPLLQADKLLDNVLLLRTLSKGYSLAGLRLGYGLGHANLIAALDKVRDSYNTDVLAQAAAIAALEHRGQASQSWKKVIAQRERLRGELEGRGCKVYPSQSNFLLVTPPSPPAAPDAKRLDARSIYEALKARDIFVRYFDLDMLRDKLRITVGDPEQNDALLAALSDLGL